MRPTRPPSPQPEPNFDTPIFISYVETDRDIAVELHAALTGAGFRPWCDAVDLRPGERWDETIPKRMQRASVVLVLVSDTWPQPGESGGAYYGPEEVAIAIDRSRRVDDEVRVIPVLLDVGQDRLPFGLRRVAPIVASRGGVDGIVRAVGRATERPWSAADSRPTRQTQLKQLTRRLSELRATDAPTIEIQTLVDERLALKRMLRAGGRLGKGDVLGDRYVLGQRLGHGGFASVWRAWDERAERVVAVKVLHGRWNGDASRIERFERGARKMATLDHPGVVRVHETLDNCDGWNYFVMEYLPGGNLHDAVMHARPPLSIDGGLRALLQVADALAHAHRRGVVHRDVKPENILLDGQGRACLTDFDLVWAADSTGGTATGALGTFLYAAPEQLDRPQSVGAKADVYGLGMTALFIVLGHQPPTMAKWRPAAVVESIDAPSMLRSLILRSIALETPPRPVDARDFARRLRDILATIPMAGLNATPHRPAMVPIRAGECLMGSPRDEPGRRANETRRQVVIARPFWMAETPVTQAQFQAVMGRNPSYFKGRDGDGERPVERVSWRDATAYCDALSKAEGLTPVYRRARWRDPDPDVGGYRLPTEAEWEYAARAGGANATHGGDLSVDRPFDSPILENIAWYGGNSAAPGGPSYRALLRGPHGVDIATQPVGRKMPNAWGLYDILGNVWEWTAERSGATQRAVRRIVRGGAFGSPAGSVRSASRQQWEETIVDGSIGFRVVRSIVD